MLSILEYYQTIPYRLSPVAFSFGKLNVDWYSLMYLVGFLVVFFLLKDRLNKKELSSSAGNFDVNNLFDFLSWIFFGLLIGGRLGYVFLYDFSYYFYHPWAIISPFDFATGNFIGIYGMSYHGGLLGAILGGLLYSKVEKLDFCDLANFVAPAVPAGYFFGRLGNFINGELYGRVTAFPWGMYFPADRLGKLRHPSALYEALLEGLILFTIFWKFRNSKKIKKNIFAFYLIGYAIARIIGEFFREPDEQIGYILGFLTLGQILSGAMFVVGWLLIFSRQKRRKMI